ncbi:hypothetical protein Taro_013305 [Colocasia esculenta]|uniref:Auxin response factor n=1 Tax=Colocasia esculenta TaxID=4460 RepID=A0A843UBH6_COLES|nr:hypothetical protein [Colocasia esculenta]
MAGIDLNAVEEDGGAAVAPPPHGHRQPPPYSTSSVCMELWHACAGPLISLPRKGSVVVYLPQGHLEQVVGACGVGAADSGLARRDVPPHIFCRVVDVKLHAEASTDEVYAELSLVPEDEKFEEQLRQGKVEEEGDSEEVCGKTRSSVATHMFCKTLTASDTSTHGGFSVPRRAAEDCFPPLDYKQQRPSQELVAKDLHGTEWRFRHIYRGNDGELRLGIRRAGGQLKYSTPNSVLLGQSLSLGNFSAVLSAVSSRRMFQICYNPRESASDFVIPFWKFSKSLNNSLSVGMKFKIRFEREDAAERRFTGIITGISDMDPVRWPGSKWKCFHVRWDGNIEIHQQNRVSPWEIEPYSSVSGSNCLSSPGSKRTKASLTSVNPDFPVPYETGCPDFGESARFHKVLQGQEVLGFRPPYGCIDAPSHQYSKVRCIPDASYSMLAAAGSNVGVSRGKSDISCGCIDFPESMRFHKVLQGQEIFPFKSQCMGSQGAAPANGNAGSRWPQFCGYSSLVQQQSTPSMQVSSPSSVFMFQHATSQLPCNQSLRGANDVDTVEDANHGSAFESLEVSSGRWSFRHHHTDNDLGEVHSSQCLGMHGKLATNHAPMLVSKTVLAEGQDSSFHSGSSCRLFGFPLIGTNQEKDGLCGTPSPRQSLADANVESSPPSVSQMSTKERESNCTKMGTLYDVYTTPLCRSPCFFSLL